MGKIQNIRRRMLEIATKAVVRPFERELPPSGKVAIVVPMSARAELTDDERISMRQLLHHLGSYDKFLLAPQGMELDFKGFTTKWFPRRFFGSAAAHGRLLGNRFFYREFLDYEFVFFYHLDSLAFSDQLEDWCAAGIDYIGPPWVTCEDSPWVDRPRVGNGGFTLLRVDSALKALTNQYLAKPSSFWFDLFTSASPRWLIRALGNVESAFPRFWAVKRLMDEWRELDDPAVNNRNNDVFWSDMAAMYLPGFKVASFEDGLRFAFEVSPRTCLEMNGGRMPFGCHAWARYDRAFWEPFLVPADGRSVVQDKSGQPAGEYFEATTRTA